jgi:hypothetical protein
MTTKSRGPRALPPGIVEPLTPAEQAHVDSAGAAALEPGAPTDAAPSEPPADVAAAAPPADPPGETSDAAADAPRAAEDTRPKMVPHAALHEEREARKAAEKRAQALEARTNQIVEALRMVQTAGAAPSPAAPAETAPTFDKDPSGHLLARFNELRQEVGALTQQRAADQHTAAINTAWQRARQLEQEFARQTPDHDAAVQHLRQVRHQQLAALGFTDPAVREHRLMTEAQQIALIAMSNNRNPAEALYEMAKLAGYRATEPTAAATRPVEPAAPAAARLATAASGQRQAGALGTVRGSGPQPMNLQRLLELSDSEFTRAIATPEGRALLGS